MHVAGSLVLGLLALAVVASRAWCAPAPEPSSAELSSAEPSSAEPQPAAVRSLHALFDREWAREVREDPVEASLRGDRTYNDRWPDRSAAAIAESHRADLRALAELGRIPRDALPAEEQLNYDLFRWKYEDRLDSWRFHEYVFPLNQLDGIQSS